MKLKTKISWLMETIQQNLFPYLDESLPLPLTDLEKRVVKILEIVKIERHIQNYSNCKWIGRPLKEREAIARSFVVKAVLKLKHTSSLRNHLLSSHNLRLICGFGRRNDVPSESTFSRAFAEFTEHKLGTIVHDALVNEHLCSELLGHVSRDSTAVVGREKPAKKIKGTANPSTNTADAPKPAKKPVEPSRLPKQRVLSAEEAVALLPTACDRGVKKNAKGFLETWYGYKLHLDVNDCGLPLSLILTSASVHDSQVAIPLMKCTSSKVTYCYDLMDSAYDASLIREQSIELGHVPIIDRNKRQKEVPPMAPHEATRYNERTAIERCNGRLKEDFGWRNVMVRGSDKVMTHLMFGVVALFADQLIKVCNP